MNRDYSAVAGVVKNDEYQSVVEEMKGAMYQGRKAPFIAQSSFSARPRREIRLYIGPYSFVGLKGKRSKLEKGQ